MSLSVILNKRWYNKIQRLVGIIRKVKSVPRDWIYCIFACLLMTCMGRQGSVPGRIGFSFLLWCGSKGRALWKTGRKWWFLCRVREESCAWKTLPKHCCCGYLIDNLKVGRREIRCRLIFSPLPSASITWLVTNHSRTCYFLSHFGKEEKQRMNLQKNF